ncbi:MAG: diacylglycerol kinase family protein [Actinoplanes sp.]
MTRAHWSARLALLLPVVAALLLLATAGVRASFWLLVTAAVGSIVTIAGAWWFLSHRGWRRWFAAVLAVAAPVTVAVLYARESLIWVVVVCGLLWSATLAAGRSALTAGSGPQGPVETEAPPPRRPYLIMNPRSGSGKVVKFKLAERARELGAEVCLLDGPVEMPVADIARQAVRDGADLLGVAGGDGTQALVAEVAAASGVPFLVVSAGTRNHFALDLGLDREDPSRCLDALTDGVEVRVDLGRAAGRVFVNNASFGAYAAIVQRPEYRDDKTRTTLNLLPDLLSGHEGPHLKLRTGDVELSGSQAILVSNNPYASDDVAGLGRRYALDGGVLGVLAVHIRGASDATSLLTGGRPGTLTVRTGTEVIIDADVPEVPAGIDGETVLLPTPVRCTIEPGALRVRVPRNRPGVPARRPELDWARLRQLAFRTG